MHEHLIPDAMRQDFLITPERGDEAAGGQLDRTGRAQPMFVQFGFEGLEGLGGIFGKTKQREVTKPHGQAPVLEGNRGGYSLTSSLSQSG